MIPNVFVAIIVSVHEILKVFIIEVFTNMYRFIDTSSALVLESLWREDGYFYRRKRATLSARSVSASLHNLHEQYSRRCALFMPSISEEERDEVISVPQSLGPPLQSHHFEMSMWMLLSKWVMSWVSLIRTVIMAWWASSPDEQVPSPTQKETRVVEVHKPSVDVFAETCLHATSIAKPSGLLYDVQTGTLNFLNACCVGLEKFCGASPSMLNDDGKELEWIRDLLRLHGFHPGGSLVVEGADSDDGAAGAASNVHELPLWEQWTTHINEAVSLLHSGVDTRPVSQFISSAGYPCDEFDVVTTDGYELPLHRIPNRTSRKVVYFQHGVLDSSMCWVATGQGPAFAVYDTGDFDVFLGNLRGTGQRKTARKQDQYWNFSADELGVYDIHSILHYIRNIKRKELGSSNDLEIIVVAHSLGCAATMIYLCTQLMHDQVHHISKCVFLAPAGMHKFVPLFAQILGPILDRTLVKCVDSIHLPSQFVQRLIAKWFQDLRSLPATKELISVVLNNILGGSTSQGNFIARHPLMRLEHFVYNFLLSGTSVKLYEHFRQMAVSKKFQAFDYGSEEENMAHYNSILPHNYLELLQLVDIPVYFVAGGQDNIIPQQNVELLYESLASKSPHLAHFHVFPNFGHVDFTYGLHEQVVTYVMRVIAMNN